jgi:hypothetical protein
MGFTTGKDGVENGEKKAKRSPLAGLFGLGGHHQDEQELPEMDVAAGLDRALRLTSPAVATSTAREASCAENIRDALASIENALYSIDKIRDIIEQAYEVTISAQDVEDIGGRALLAESYDELRLSINAAVEAIDEKAAMLIGKSLRQIDVKLGGKAHYSISPVRLDVTAKGLNLNPPRDAFATFDEINEILDELDTALKKADRAASGYCRDAQFLIARLHTAEAA